MEVKSQPGCWVLWADRQEARMAGQHGLSNVRVFGSAAGAAMVGNQEVADAA
jgi:hypothetical protein